MRKGMKVRALRHNETGSYVGGYFGDRKGIAGKLVELGHGEDEARRMADKLGMMSIYELSKEEDDYDGVMRIVGDGYKELFPRESVTILKDDELQGYGYMDDDEEDDDDGLFD